MTDGLAGDNGRVREAVRAVLTSPLFGRSSRMSRFLRHVVDAGLAGDDGDLKETSIGVAVFDRSPDYDPKVDPVVRNEARRLRATLERYYAADGADDPIRISIPKGGYRPQFDVRVTSTGATDTADAADFSAAAGPVEATRPTGAPRAVDTSSALAARPRSHRWLVTVSAIVALVLVAVAATVLIARLTRARAAGMPGPRIHTLTTYREREIHPSIAPDSRHVAFSWDRHGNYDIHVKTVSDDTPVRLTTNTANDLHPSWSPDGTHVAFARAAGSGFDVLIVPAHGGGPERLVTRIENVEVGKPLEEVLLMLGNPGPAWSRDGRSLAVTSGGRDSAGRPLRLVPVDPGAPVRGPEPASSAPPPPPPPSSSSSPASPSSSSSSAPSSSSPSSLPAPPSRILTTPPSGAHDFFPAFSPDGAWLAFCRQQTNSTSELFVVPVKGGPERRLEFGRGDLRGIAWMPDGRSLIVSSNLAGAYQLWNVRLDGGTPELLPTAGRSAREPSVAPDGTWIAYSDASLRSELWRVRTALAAEGPGEPELLVGSTRQNHSAQYSPDGRSLAFVSDRSGSWEVWGSAADGSQAAQLTRFEGPLLGTVHWSPDSRFLAFDARPAGHSAIYVMPSAGGTPSPLDDNRFEEKMPAWSRDGSWLYFNSNREGAQQLWRAARTGAAAARVSDRFAMDSVEAPDGSAVYFLDRDPGIWQATPGAGAAATRVPGLEQVVTRRLWAANATGLWFLDHAVDRQAIWLYRFSTRRTERVARLGDAVVLDVPGLSVSRDDRWLVYSRQADSTSDLWTIGRAGGLP